MMNKQELIDILENLECSTESLSYDNGYEQGVYDSLSHVILLDEPQKQVVPKCAEEWLEGHCAASDVINLFIEVTCATDSDGFISDKWRWSGEFYDWLVEDSDTLYILCDALRYGYEVEKEQLYYVLLPETGEHELKYFLDQDGELSVDDQLCEYYKLTEQEIKAIDERYWPFAVKVDGE